MRGINKVILVGLVGKTPSIHYLDTGMACAKFSLATDEVYKNKNNERITVTEWHNIVMWQQLAENAAAYIKKGMLLYIEGKIQSRSWDDKSGMRHYVTDIVANTFTMLSNAGNKDDDKPSSETLEQTVEKLIANHELDELPF